MSDPKRWADDGGDATAFEQDLFRAGRAAGLPAEERRLQWFAIAEQSALLPAASAPATPHALAGKAATKGLAGTGWLKALALLPVLAGAGAGVYALSHAGKDGVALPGAPHAAALAPAPARNNLEADVPRHDEPVVPDEPIVPAPRAPATKGAQTPGRVRDRAVAAAASTATPVATNGASAETADEAAATSHLAEEARAVLEARNALRSSNPSAALRVLDDARVRFPNGSLGQEREALTIEGLARTGRRDVAQARARAFLTRFPNSPLASNVRRFE